MKIEIINWECGMKKAGVSLVTVLLFMLVATIAATATYKWLTSEGRSSASRMQQQEAYQSAVAGIESARSWMTYNANETGAIIKQYKDGNNAPVKLTDRLAAFVRPGQHYDVYLVGVNTENTTYKLKILSEGTSRNGKSKHSEGAILNVNGLYRVMVPVIESHTPIDFNYAYFGGSYDGAGSLTLSSAIVNGNWEGNPQGVHGTFLVTGDAKLTGDNVVLGPLACVGGDFLPENNGLRAGNLYVGGNVTGNMSLDSNAYFDGNVTNKDGGVFDIKGSVTLNGKLSPLPSLDFKIHKNFCATETGVVHSSAGTDANHKAFLVEGNVWMPGNRNLAYGKVTGSGCRCKHKTIVSYWPYIERQDTISCDYGSWGMIDCTHYGVSDAGSDNYASYQKIKLGEKKESDVYIKSGYPWSSYKALREDRTFSTANTQLRNCKSGSCSGTGEYENWKNETFSPYIERFQKADLYYIYYLPSGVRDVDFGSYNDPDWNKEVYSFFVNAPANAKNAETRFTNSEHSSYRFLNFEDNNIVGSPYCKKMDGKNYVPACGVSPWFSVKGHFHNDLPATKPFECAESVKSRCDGIWKRNDARACDGSPHFVEDPLVTAKSIFQSYASYGCAATITTYDASLVTKLNACYKQLHDDNAKRRDSLYNDFLVVRVSGGTTSTNPTGKLQGRFIVIATDSVYTSFMDTEDTSYVFYYLEKGIHTLNDATRKNTFIYTEGGIGTGNQFNLTGTIYATAASCSGMGKLQSSSVTYDPNLMQVLSDAKILCANDGSTCGGTGGGSTSSSASSSISDGYSTGGYDNYYIAVAPQLSVTLESQYKNAEEVNANRVNEVDASFIVLPRIIYLTRDAKGKLENYYNIVPLNSAYPVTSPSISCNGGIPTTGKLVPGDTKLVEGDYLCLATGSVQSKTGPAQQTVPFWVRVTGDGGNLPTVSFAETTKEVNIGGSTPVTLVLPGTPGGATQTCQVELFADYNSDEWTVTPRTGVTPLGDNKYSVTVTTEEPKPVFTVNNVSSADGSAVMYITETSGCYPGGPEVIFNANTAPIERKSIADYCLANTSDANCLTGGDYDRIKDRPDCNTTEEWVVANGVACSASDVNNRWGCAISGAVSLSKVKDVAGCQVVIAPVSHDAPLEANKNPPYYLYASLKKVPMTFHAGFDVEGTLAGDRKIKISVEDDNGGSRESECSYADFVDLDKREEKCDVKVYHGSEVTLSLEPENPAEFNYWKCENGPDCVDDEAYAGLTYSMTISSDDNMVYAHFGEKDKHCFFDEFKEPTHGEGYRHNRDYIECGHETDYCIDFCENDGNRCMNVLTTSSFPNAKWRLVSASTATMNDIDYSVVDGRIALKSSATRGRKESEKKYAVIMSSVQAGLYGTLKAQFQPAREGTSTGDVAMASSMNSGFILRSDPSVSSFLKLNVFIASDGTLKARLSLNGAPPWKEESLVRNGSATYSPERNAIVLMSATIGKETETGNDVLKVDVYSSAWSNDPYSATFVLTDENISGVSGTANVPNEYVGYTLSNQNFKIYGIGWKSDSYRSECWDTYPVLSCSFKAAYTGGIVPKGTNVKPWVGMSAWYDAVGRCNANDVGYYYKGTDACGGTGSTYSSCGSGYTFSATGAHGYLDNEGNEVKTAKVDIDRCSVYGEEASWARNGVAANCGPFWVGEQNSCSRHYTFESTVTTGEGEYFGLASGTANFRGATLIVNLDNPDSKPVEVYMFSKNEEGYYSYTYGNTHIYSLPYQSNVGGNGIALTIPVSDLSNTEGFDPEKVVGVFVKTFGETSIAIQSVMSSCPNAVEITGCNAKYEGGSWKISATVKNQVYMDKINVTEEHSHITSPSSLECLKVSDDEAIRCKFTGDNAEFSWSDNPFTHVNDSYSFKIVLTSTETTTSECTATGSVTGITATCGEISGTTAIQGKGIPQFTYSIANCPDDACNFKIDLVKGGSVAATISSSTSSGNVSNAQTATNAANGTSDMLDEGTYKFRLSSTNAARPFTECESENSFTVSAPGSISATCSFGTVVKGETATLSMSNIENNEESTTISIERSGADAIEKTLTANNNSQSFTFTAPNSASSYTYDVYYTVNSTKKKICDATLTVVDGLGCSVSPSTITLGESFTFTPSYGGSCTSASLTGNGTITGSGCSATSFTVEPSSVGSQEYTYTFSGDIGSNLTCKQTVTVNPPAPEFSCPTGWAATVGSSATLTLSPTYCDNNACTMKITGIDDDFVTFSSPRTFADASATASTNKYTVAIKNGTGTTTKDCAITYTSTSSTYQADCWFDKNGEVTEIPTGYQYSNFKAKTKSGFPSNTSGKLKFNNTEYNFNLYSNGNTSDYSNLPMPNVAGTYPYEVVYNSEKVCEGTITVVDPVTCSVNPSAVSSGTSVTFTAAANTSLSSTYSLDIANKCGFKINGNWKDGKSNTDQGLSSGTYSQNVTSTTEFTFACNNNYSCSKKVVLANPPEIACAALTSTKKTGDPVSIRPVVENCENNCEWHISGYENLDHNTRDWSSGGTIGLSTVNSDGAKNYKLTVENDYGHNDCNFTITYSSGAVCHCKCTNGCPDNVITTGWDGSNTGGCYFVSAFKIGAWNSSEVEVNGTSTFSNTEKSDSDYPTKVDGGYYIQFRRWSYPNIATFTAAEPNCN